METKERTLSILVQNWGKSNKVIEQKLKDFSLEQIAEELKGFDVYNVKERSNFLWKIQNEVERFILNNVNHETSNSFESEFTYVWNQNNEVEVNPIIVSEILSKIGLGSNEEQQFFREISSGLLDKKNMTEKNSKLFVSILLRLLILITDRDQQEKIAAQINEITFLFTDSLSTKNILDELKNSGLAYKVHNSLKFPGMKRYQSIVRLEDLVFSKGLLKILATQLIETDMSENLCELHKKIRKIFESEEVNDATENQSISKEKKSQSDVIIEQGTHRHNEENQENISIEQHQEESEETVSGEQDDISVVTSLEQAIKLVQTAIKQVTPMEKASKKELVEAESLLTQKLIIAEEEVKRLNIALEVEKEKTKQQEERIFSKLLHAIGGEQGNYLLSDLFEESQGKSVSNPNISIGRLINLFSILSVSIGLEEHTNGHDIDDVLMVTKEELIKNYHIDGPVLSKSESVKVQLTKYGWTMDGKIIVRPSVTEMKGEL